MRRFVTTSLAASSFAFDIEGAGFDQAIGTTGVAKFEKMLARLRQLDPKNKSAPNQVRDILIAETAIKNGATLVSGDSNLRQVSFRIRRQCHGTGQFMNELSGAQRFEQLSDENKSRYLAINRQMVRLARDYAVPIIFAPPLSVGGKINGASGCVVQLASGTFVVTASQFWGAMKNA